MKTAVIFTKKQGAPAPNLWASVFTTSTRDFEWEIRFQYDPELVEEIKGFIPPGFRSFDPATKAWSTDAKFAQMFAAHIRSRGYVVAGFDPPKPPPKPPLPPPPPQLTENWARELMRRVEPELREKVYRALAKVLHEDLGGDGRLMQELNDARNGIAS
jgi:hypothetical protein